MKKQKVTIIGGGNGAFAAAADLTIRGHEITLYEVPAFRDNLSQVIEKGGIELETFPSNGLKGGFAKIHKITFDIEEALAASDVVFVIVPAYSLDTIAKLCAPYVRENQIFALCPANFGGSIFFRKTLMENGCSKHVWVAEAVSMMYACRKKDASSVWIRGYKRDLGCAFFPSENSEEPFQRLKEIYPNFVNYGHVINTGLSNSNNVLHSTLMLANLSNIDNQEERLFYRECFTPSVQKILDALEAERLQFNRIPGIALIPYAKMKKGWYGYQGAQGESVRELNTSAPHCGYSKMPTSLDHRYITEDVPYGLIPNEEMMEQYNLPHQTTTAMIAICSAMCGTDFYKEARTLSDLGLKGLDEKQLISFVTYGSY
jgi:opine dehydrogenase